jgi:hypothetical protein
VENTKRKIKTLRDIKTGLEASFSVKGQEPLKTLRDIKTGLEASFSVKGQEPLKTKTYIINTSLLFSGLRGIPIAC